jgi:hypothetical protein
MAKYQDTPGSATEAQHLNFGYGQTALIDNPDDGQSLSRSLRRCARLDFYLGGLRDFYGLLDVEVENSSPAGCHPRKP